MGLDDSLIYIYIVYLPASVLMAVVCILKIFDCGRFLNGDRGGIAKNRFFANFAPDYEPLQKISLEKTCIDVQMGKNLCKVFLGDFVIFFFLLRAKFTKEIE